MTAEEIRIGNLVGWNPGEVQVCRVLTIYQTSIRCFVRDNDLEDTMFNIEDLVGLEITREWLIAFGFQTSSDNSRWISTPDYTLSLFGKNGKYSVMLEDEYGKVWLPTISFVHELQNLYYTLSGKELDDCHE